MDLPDLIGLFSTRPAYAATELPLPSAAVYVEQALAMYGPQARERVQAERGDAV